MIVLEYLIKQKKMKKKEVAEIAGAFPQALNDWLKQKRPIPKDKLYILSKYFNVPPQYMELELTSIVRDQIEEYLTDVVDEPDFIDEFTDDYALLAKWKNTLHVLENIGVDPDKAIKLLKLANEINQIK
ncbi:helix-turn-helix domain-containing protein [Metabacillus arenae]|uniref:Helix-turn-helix transcriptional regulator n=1 Tax=Metabacillus arenae TaxID=2771434 RepID=A0A926RZK9_9BACI|nr:helix-turn-helix transcriptional regulator [Metabacillus arenae]MBD1379159.1 helix-turn-helix transcriptional regulator [Metabacillus arenae]